MREVLLRKAIAVGFGVQLRWARARRRVSSWGRPLVRGLDHLTIPVRDMLEAKRFYCEVLGAAHVATVDAAVLAGHGRPLPEGEGDGVFHVSVSLGGGARIDLFQQRSGQVARHLGHPHYAFAVAAGELLAWRDRLNARGVPTEGPLQLGPPGQASVYFRDCSGNLLELTCMGYTGEAPVRAPEPTALDWPA